jgi:hypothetical protein
MAHVNPVRMQKFLRGIDYPASKEELLQVAKDNGADDRVLDALRRAPTDRFNSPNDVSEAIGKAA